MSAYVVFLLPLTISVSILSAVGLVYTMMQRNQEKINQQSNHLLNQALKLFQEAQEDKRDLLNRMQSKDLPTYQALTVFRTPQESVSDPYYSQSDEAVAARMAQSAGIGEVVFDEYTEFGDTMSELLGQDIKEV